MFTRQMCFGSPLGVRNGDITAQGTRHLRLPERPDTRTGGRGRAQSHGALTEAPARCTAGPGSPVVMLTWEGVTVGEEHLVCTEGPAEGSRVRRLGGGPFAQQEQRR